MAEQDPVSPLESPPAALDDDVELIEPSSASPGDEEQPAISEPAKVMRIGSMIRIKPRS